LDEKDLRILEMLERDARTPWRRIARELGVSEATVYLRMRKLVESGVVKGYTVRVDPASLGLRAQLFLLVRAEARGVEALRSLLREARYVAEAYEVSGNYHFLVRVLAPSIEEASKAVEEIMGVEGVVEVATFTVLRTVKEPGGLVGDYARWTGARER